jgi:hypothetical protein
VTTYRDGWYWREFDIVDGRIYSVVLYDERGGIRRKSYSLPLFGKGAWAWFNWRNDSPYGRAGLYVWSSLLFLISQQVLAVGLGDSYPFVPKMIVSAVAGLWAGNRLANYIFKRRNLHGSNRRTEADHRDTQADGTTASSTGNTAGEGTGEGAKPQLEVVRDTMPILAHRYAQIVSTPDGFMFKSVTDYGTTFGIDAEAACRVHATTRGMAWSYGLGPMPEWMKPHRPPGAHCQCGFYAVPADKLPEYRYSGVPLLVELSGRVIEHEFGYRAEHQRIVEVGRPMCPGCGQPAMRCWIGPAPSNGIVWDCGRHELMGVQVSELLMACTLDQVAGSLGVPFTNHD